MNKLSFEMKHARIVVHGKEERQFGASGDITMIIELFILVNEG
jgi:hypothetical protein